MKRERVLETDGQSESEREEKMERRGDDEL